MLHTVAISGYRSLKDMVLCLGQMNLITGPNGSGKSSIYRTLRMLAEAAEGRLIQSLAREGGLTSTLWAGPESFSREVLSGQHPVQGQHKRKKPVSLRLGFTSDEFSYTIDLGLPSSGSGSAFGLDPIIKRECLWRGSSMKPRFLCVDRRGSNLRCRPEKKWQDIDVPMSSYASMLTEYADPQNAPEMILLRDTIRTWRFYDHFRTDSDAPARRAEVGTYTPVLSGDGADLAAALQTIREVGDSQALGEAIEDAFPGSQLSIGGSDSRLVVSLKQNGMLRPLRAPELSDGTLRYLLLIAALLTPRPPELMVLNEPETSLHPDLLPALGRLIIQFSIENQVIVVTHAPVLIEMLKAYQQCQHFQLEKVFGATQLEGVEQFDLPSWNWPAR